MGKVRRVHNEVMKFDTHLPADISEQFSGRQIETPSRSGSWTTCTKLDSIRYCSTTEKYVSGSIDKIFPARELALVCQPLAWVNNFGADYKGHRVSLEYHLRVS